jgi:hypothetical protein
MSNVYRLLSCGQTLEQRHLVGDGEVERLHGVPSNGIGVHVHDHLLSARRMIVVVGQMVARLRLLVLLVMVMVGGGGWWVGGGGWKWKWK